MTTDSDKDKMAHDMIYELLYGKETQKNHNINLQDFRDILTIALESNTSDEFNIKYDLFGLENEELKEIVMRRRFENGKE